MTYIEGPADAAFTTFMASLTPGKVLRNRSVMFSKSERKLDRYLRAKTKSEMEHEQENYTGIYGGRAGDSGAVRTGQAGGVVTGDKSVPRSRDQWAGAGFVLDVAHPEQTEHRCSQCYQPGFGKSSIRCRNEPATTQTKGTR